MSFDDQPVGKVMRSAFFLVEMLVSNCDVLIYIGNGINRKY
jgi:hypothetical protein